MIYLQWVHPRACGRRDGSIDLPSVNGRPQARPSGLPARGCRRARRRVRDQADRRDGGLCGRTGSTSSSWLAHPFRPLQLVLDGDIPDAPAGRTSGSGTSHARTPTGVDAHGCGSRAADGDGSPRHHKPERLGRSITRARAHGQDRGAQYVDAPMRPGAVDCGHTVTVAPDRAFLDGTRQR